MAFGGSSLALFPLGLPALVALLGAGAAPEIAGVGPGIAALGGVAVTGLLCLATGAVSYRVAARTFERYTLS